MDPQRLPRRNVQVLLNRVARLVGLQSQGMEFLVEIELPVVTMPSLSTGGLCHASPGKEEDFAYFYTRLGGDSIANSSGYLRERGQGSSPQLGNDDQSFGALLCVLDTESGEAPGPQSRNP